MSTLVPLISDEEPTMAVARFIADLAWADAGKEVAEPEVAQFVGEAERLWADERYGALVSLLLTSADIIIAKGSDKDVECIFSVIISLLGKAEKPEEGEKMGNEIAAKLTANPAEKTALKLKLLLFLYNMLGSPSARYQLYMQCLHLALDAKAPELMAPSLKRLDNQIREWGIGPKEQRPLYLALTNASKDSKGSARDSFVYLLKYLGTFDGEGAETLAEAKEEAVRAAVEYIKAPDVFQTIRFADQTVYINELLDMASLRQLEEDPKHSPTYRLLQIFLAGYLDDYLKFHAQNPGLEESLGLVHEDCLTKMRLLSLAALATESPHGEVRYSLIQDTLQVEEDDVEVWIVRAVGLKLLEAKMDQMREVMIVNRVTQRSFGPAQWKELRGKLGVWKEKLANVSRIVQNAITTGAVPRGP